MGQFSIVPRDIDIFDNDELVLSVEVKDKQFSLSDVDHAVKKTVLANKNKMLFVMGLQAVMEKNILSSFERKWEDSGFFINFLDVLDLVKMALIVSSNKGSGNFILYVGEFAKLARVKDEVITHFEKCIKLDEQ